MQRTQFTQKTPVTLAAHARQGLISTVLNYAIFCSNSIFFAFVCITKLTLCAHALIKQEIEHIKSLLSSTICNSAKPSPAPTPPPSISIATTQGTSTGTIRESSTPEPLVQPFRSIRIAAWNCRGL